MKKIIFLTIVLFSFTYSVNAVEKRDCSGIKKISKAYIVCKSVVEGMAQLKVANWI